MKKLYAILFFSLPILQSFAQQYTVTGKVSRESDDKGLRGVHIMVKGDNIYTATISDENGLYRIEVTKGDTLSFWGMGYKAQEIKVKKNKYNIRLEEDEESIDLLAEITSQLTRLYKDTTRFITCRPCTENGLKRQDSINYIQRKLDSINMRIKKRAVITGKIIQQKSEKDLVGVIIENKQNKEECHITNSKGSYRIVANIGDTLTFSRFDHFPVEIEVTGNTLDITMTPTGIKYEPDELMNMLDDINWQINRQRDYRPKNPCPRCWNNRIY
jgi:hypothetical protein